MVSGLENPLHLLIIALILLVFFGSKRLPEMGRSMGSGLRSFRDGLAGRELPDDEPVEPSPTELQSAGGQPSHDRTAV